MAFVKSLGLLFLGIWLGTAIFFSAVVAPAAFSVLRAYQVQNYAEIAGGIVNRSLAVVNTSGFIISLLLLLIVLVLRTQFGKTALALQLITLLVVAAMTGLGQWVIAARMHAIRSALQVPMDQLPLQDAQRVAFGSLHRYSVSALAVAILAALAAYVLLARNTRMN